MRVSLVYRRIEAETHFLAHVRTLGDETVVGILNASRESRSPEIDARGVLAEGAALVNMWSSEGIRVTDGRSTGFT